MSICDCSLFGRVITSRKNTDNSWTILVEELSGATTYNKWTALPKKYEIKIHETISIFGASTPNITHSNPSYTNWIENKKIGQLISFIIEVKINVNKNISGFKIKTITSLDLDADIDYFLEEIIKTGRANSTTLPLYQYFTFKQQLYSVSYGDRVDVNQSTFEIACIDTTPFYPYTIADSLVRPSLFNPSGKIELTLVNSIRANQKDLLNIENISLIFDKFYRPIRGLGFNFEYTYGESVTYKISQKGDIIHCFHEDSVSSKEDTSSDRTSHTETVVMRLGDRLTAEMLEFLEEPVKGHYSPNILFRE